MGDFKLTFRIEILLVALACLLSLALRSYPIHDLVFTSEGVHFFGADPFFHMRTVDNLARHFPQRSGFDPYMLFGGQNVPTGPLFDWLIAGTALLLGGGEPNQEWIDLVGAWTPAVMGVLTAAVVWLIARMLFGGAAGLAAAFLVAILPGNFFELSRLGFADHHAAEALLFCGVWAGVAFALKVGIAAGRRYWMAVAAAGVCLGAFLANRPAGAFLVVFIVLWAGLDCLVRHFRRESCWEVGLATAPAFLIAASIFIPVGGMIWSGITLLILAVGLAAVVALAGLSAWLTARQARLLAYPAAIVGAAAAIAGVAYLAAPDVVLGILGTLHRLSSSQTVLTIRELHPLLVSAEGSWSFEPAYQQFTTAFFLFPIAYAGLLLESFGGREDSNRRLFLVLGACFLAATLAQNRMAIYFAPVAAVGVGWLVSEVAHVTTAGLRRDVRVVIVAAVLALVYLPNLYAMNEQARAFTGINDEWIRALHWVRDETPEPLGDPDAYFAYEPRRSTPYLYPPSVYSVMIWWDYGYWLLREGRRIPTSNGTQGGAVDAARYFVETDPVDAAQLLQSRRSRYVVTDPTLPLWRHQETDPSNAKFRSMLIWSGAAPRDYSEYFIRVREGKREIVTVFYPEYYRSMLTRLHHFDAKAFEPNNSTWVISYQERQASFGSYRRISSMRRFKTYPEAQKYIDARPDQQLVLAGLLPNASCVPLEALDDYRLAYESSDDKLAALNGYRAVKVFEYQGIEDVADDR